MSAPRSTLALALFCILPALSHAEHAGTAGTPSSTRPPTDAAANQRVVDFQIQQLGWDKKDIAEILAPLLPTALEAAAAPAKTDELPIAVVAAKLFGTVNATQLQQAFTAALADKKKLEAKPESERSASDNQYLAFLDRLLWAGRITKLGLPGFDMLDDVKTPEPKFSAFETAFKKAFATVLADNEQFHEKVAAINQSDDPDDRKKKQKELLEAYAGIPKFLDGQVATSEKDSTGEKVAAAVAAAIAQENATGHQIDLVGSDNTPLRVDLGPSKKQFTEGLRQARKNFPPLANGGFGGTRVALEPAPGTVQTFTPKLPSPTLDDRVSRMFMQKGCLNCHGPSSKIPLLNADGELLPGNLASRFVQVLEGCGGPVNSQMGKVALGFREKLAANDKKLMEEWAAAKGIANVDFSTGARTPAQCEKWKKDEKPPTPPVPPVDGKYDFAKRPKNIKDAQSRGILNANPLVEIADLAKKLDPANPLPPLVLNIGDEGKIKGSINIGVMGKPAKLAKLEEALKQRKPGQELIIYCGCCPTDECIPVMEALHSLGKLGVRDGRVLNFRFDGKNFEGFKEAWADKGYPVEN